MRTGAEWRRARVAEVAQTIMTCAGCGKDQPFNWKRWNSIEKCECGSEGFAFDYVKNPHFRIGGDTKPYMTTDLQAVRS